MPQRSISWHGALYLLCAFSLGSASAASELNAIPASCTTSCATPYGTIVGVTVDGTNAYSNCNADCVVFSPNQESTTYSGIKWQCVEFARRWLIRNRGESFGDVNTAADIWKLDSYTRLADGAEIFATNRLNGSAQSPQKGDLLIYAKEYLGTGHVAVVIEVDATQSILRVGEQNFDNRPWPARYARSIPFVQQNSRYWVLDAYLLGWKHAD